MQLLYQKGTGQKVTQKPKKCLLLVRKQLLCIYLSLTKMYGATNPKQQFVQKRKPKGKPTLIIARWAFETSL